MQFLYAYVLIFIVDAWRTERNTKKKGIREVAERESELAELFFVLFTLLHLLKLIYKENMLKITHTVKNTLQKGAESLETITKK